MPHLAEGILAPGVDEAGHAFLQVICQLLEGVDWVVYVLGCLEVPPKANLANHIKALPLQRQFQTLCAAPLLKQSSGQCWRWLLSDKLPVHSANSTC